MAEYLVDHTLHGRVRVNLDTPIKDQTELNKALNGKIKAGEFSTVESDGQPKSILARADAAYRAMADMATQAVGGVASSGLQGLGVPEDYANPIGQGAARFVIPQSPMEAGLMLGTMGAGGLAAKAGLTGAKAIGARVLGSVAGGAAGGAISEDPGTGAAMGGVTGAVAGVGGEVVGMTLSKASKVIGTLLRGGSQEAVARVQAKGAIEMGKVFNELPELASIAPSPLGGVTQLQRGTSILEGYNTPQSIRNLVKNDHGIRDKVLGGAYEDSMNLLTSKLPTGAVFTDPLNPPITKMVAGIPVTSGGKSVSFQEAKDGLSKLRERAYTTKQANPETANIMGKDAKELFNDSKELMRNEMLKHDPTGEATAIFDAAQMQYRVATNLLDSLKPAFRGKTNDRILFDVSALQNHYADKQPLLQKELTQSVYDRVTKGLKVDGIIGMVNQPPPGMKGLGVGKSGGVGGGYIRENIGQYLSGPPRLAGRHAPSGIARTGIDVGTGRAVAPIAQGALDEMQ